MKNPLHLFRSRRTNPSGIVDFSSAYRSGGPSAVTIVVSLLLLFACFGGLAAGLRWLKNDEPKDDRPWEPHETLMAAPSADGSGESTFESDADALATLPAPSAPSTSPEASPPPAIAEEPPEREERERVEDAPPLPVEASKAGSARKPSSPRPAKPRRKEGSSSPKPVSPARKRTAEPTTKASDDRSAFDARESDARAFIRPFRSYQDGAEPEIPERADAFYDDREEYFDRVPAQRSLIEADPRNYYRRRPCRAYTVLEPPRLVAITPANVVVRFRINYPVRGSRAAVYGYPENRMPLRRVSSGFRIIAIQERRLADDY